MTLQTKRFETTAGLIGLSDVEASRFSLTRALAAELDPGMRQFAGFEKEVLSTTGAAMQAAGYETRGMRLPTEITERILPWLSQRVLTASGGVSSGGALVQSTVKGDA